MRASRILLFTIAGCAPLREYTPWDSAARMEAKTCRASAPTDEGRLASAAAIAAVEPFTVLLSS
jgi:hypothetical protein